MIKSQSKILYLKLFCQMHAAMCIFFFQLIQAAYHVYTREFIKNKKKIDMSEEGSRVLQRNTNKMNKKKIVNLFFCIIIIFLNEKTKRKIIFFEKFW